MAYDKRALLVGINYYSSFPELKGCVRDAERMSELLEQNEDGTPNYECLLLKGEIGGLGITRRELRRQWLHLFDQDFKGDALFYFSGHGSPTHAGGALVTQDGERDDPGLFMSELMTLANSSNAESVLLILDCCYSGSLGDAQDNLAHLGKGVTILAASGSSEKAIEDGGYGVFTRLVLGALEGGAADVRGHVTAASIYGYVEQTLGAWEQGPMYKSHTKRHPTLRRSKPAVDDALLRELPRLFSTPDFQYPMAPSFEFTRPEAKPEHVAIFNKFKALRNARMLTTQEGLDLFFIAEKSKTVSLTPLGQFYWHLADRRRIR